MKDSIPASVEDPPHQLHRHWLWSFWLALWPLAGLLYLLPVSLPGERWMLLVCLAGLWAGIIGAFWQYRWLRIAAFAVALLHFFPIRSGSTRLLLLLGMTALWLAAVFVFRQRKAVLASILVCTAVIGGFLLLPGQEVNRTHLWAEYVRSLRPYQGTFYVWGGENRIGIDCSGIVRCGWIDANLRYGLRTANPVLVRNAIQIWWQDCSAKELGDGYRDRTHMLFKPTTLNSVDYSQLMPGDVAVTMSGVHTLAYLGSNTWIEADPNVWKVITITAPSSNIWCEVPMQIVRWRGLE